MPADMLTPVGVYLRVRDMYPVSALLESSDYHTVQDSYSYIGVEPIASFTVSLGQVIYTYPDGSHHETATAGADVPALLRDYIAGFRTEGDGASSTVGFLGYSAYDAVRYFESVSIQDREERFEDIPDMVYVLYRYVICINHYRHEMSIVEHRLPGDRSKIGDLMGILANNNVAQYGFRAGGDVESSLTDEEYMDMVGKGIASCRRGDVFQIVLSRRFSQSFEGDEFCVYRALRCVNPSPYLFYFDFGSFRIFGSSPETHLRVCGNRAYIDPIAGTFRRTGDDARDRMLAEELLADVKENAEHVMLVDLARNDLSRSGGHVGVEFLRQIQYYSHVIHMVSRVGATLPDGTDVIRLMADTFPAGTLSGAPKVRAMQLIDEYEPHSRVVYGGCIGSIGFDGSLNQAITIRSFLSSTGRLYYQAGAGVTVRSIPANELKETSNKLGALNAAIDYAQKFV